MEIIQLKLCKTK